MKMHVIVSHVSSGLLETPELLYWWIHFCLGSVYKGVQIASKTILIDQV